MSDDAVGAGDGGEEPEVADCEETVHRLYHFLDGELTEDRRRAIRAHLDDCGPCVDVVGFEAELRRVVADRCRDRVPDQLRERVARLIDHERVVSGGASD
ncbi:MAG TPA: mycothiol system anti-sigma-R factor [Acidimicrobiales bacterium]|nr:mycothiol system anti-sigma-R factor [Acidimicrobiales bacterium]